MDYTTYLCDNGHIVSVDEEVFECPFCKSTNIKPTSWLNVPVDPLRWDIYEVTLDDNTKFNDLIPVYNVEELFGA